MAVFKKTVGQGPDVVLFHGWCCRHQHMQSIVDMLSSHYRVHNFDLPGIGQTPWNEKIKTIHDLADILLPELPEKAIYLGWSFGGLVATSIAARYPERVERFIGVTTTPKFITTTNWPGVPRPGFRFAFETAMKLTTFKQFFTQLYETEFAFPKEKSPEHQYLLVLLDEFNTVDKEVLFNGIDICDDTDLRDEFASLNCPIDFIMGDKDDNIPVACYEPISQLNSNFNLHVIPNAHHMPFWTHQSEFKTLLNSILDLSDK